MTTEMVAGPKRSLKSLRRRPRDTVTYRPTWARSLASLSISLEKEEMWELCQEVWDAIPIEDLRPYMRDTEERCKIIRQTKGEWVGWSKDGVARHGQSV